MLCFLSSMFRALNFLSIMMYFLIIIVVVDIISAIEFDKTGDHLATGDRGGRVVLFERTDTKEVGFFTMQLRRYIKNWRLFLLIMSLLHCFI